MANVVLRQRSVQIKKKNISDGGWCEFIISEVYTQNNHTKKIGFKLFSLGKFLDLNLRFVEIKYLCEFTSIPAALAIAGLLKVCRYYQLCHNTCYIELGFNTVPSLADLSQPVLNPLVLELSVSLSVCDLAIFRTGCAGPYPPPPPLPPLCVFSLHFFFFIRTSKIQVRLPMFLGFWNFSILHCCQAKPSQAPAPTQLAGFS